MSTKAAPEETYDHGDNIPLMLMYRKRKKTFKKSGDSISMTRLPNGKYEVNLKFTNLSPSRSRAGRHYNLLRVDQIIRDNVAVCDGIPRRVRLQVAIGCYVDEREAKKLMERLTPRQFGIISPPLL